MKLTALVVTMLRDNYLYKCVDTLKETYPDIKIKVADNGDSTPDKKKKLEDMGISYDVLPFDSGLCVARNFLANKTRTKYVLVGDDDFAYSDASNVDKMVQFLEDNPDIDLIGGAVKEGGKIRHYEGFLDLTPHHFVYKPLEQSGWKQSSGLRYKECELTFNFFVARTKAIKDVLWDEKIKVAYEHSDFFISLKNKGYKVAYTPDCVVEHKPKVDGKQHPDYGKYRSRRSDKDRFYKKWKLDAITDMSGRTFHYDRGGMDVAFVIKTLKRRESLEKLLYSIAKYYPYANVYIGDDDQRFDVGYYKQLWAKLDEAGLKRRPVAFNLPFDSGLSYGRNFLVRKTKQSYVLLLDDDFIFTENTDIEKLFAVMDTDADIGMVGGMLLNKNGTEMHFEGRFEKVGDDIFMRNDEKEVWLEADDVKYRQTGVVLNFGLFRRELFNDVKWDDNIKISGEHTDFYLRLNDTKWKVMYCPEVTAIHAPTAQEDYTPMRRRKEFLKVLFNKHEARRLIYPNGQVYEYDREKDKIKLYKI